MGLFFVAQSPSTEFTWSDSCRLSKQLRVDERCPVDQALRFKEEFAVSHGVDKCITFLGLSFRRCNRVRTCVVGELFERFLELA